ncbi:calcitonin-1-like isoform X1 [Silurus meridionalis]|uniref:calcitonin-1-like isoform X1 n=1 Tax=Silurus meridionalis TaxID=175797 RepID=UPI001EEC19BF|nr:calcitonin-1-like isoform X1 [Silurus meridionalis]KAI5105626.1 calcitoninprotein-related peptide 2 isoform X1 [Silurus meridionalis]
MMKLSTILIVSVLTICHLYGSHAAPLRPVLDSLSDHVFLSEYEARRLLNAIVKEFVQMTVESDPKIDISEGRVLVKRCSSLSTCVLGKFSQELHKLQTFPRTDVGAGTPGKKRSANYEETLELA